MTQRDYNMWELILTRVLPIVVTLIGAYLLLFADLRYVKKSDYDKRGEQLQSMVTDVEVIKSNSNNMKEQLDRIERRISQ